MSPVRDSTAAGAPGLGTNAAIEVRAATEADIPAVQGIYAHHVQTGLGTFEEEPPTVVEMLRRFDELRGQGAPYLIAEADPSQVLGYAYAGPFRTRSAYRYTCENAVYVAHDHQRGGIGRALMLELIARARALGLQEMLAVIGDSGNAASIGLHARLGFRPVGTFDRVGYKFGRWVDVVLMQLSLRAQE